MSQGQLAAMLNAAGCADEPPDPLLSLFGSFADRAAPLMTSRMNPRTWSLPMRAFLLSAALACLAWHGASAQDASSGEKIFTQCKACHQIGENAQNAVGPVLNGVIGRHSGIYEGYSYSAANKNSGLTWEEATFREYIRDPRAKVPGTKMIFAGIKDDKKIEDLLAYLKQFDASGKKKD